MQKAIYKFYWDCGRMGNLEGIFVCKKSDIEALIGKDIDFGEVLGKHSDIYGNLETTDLTVMTEDQDFIKKYIELFGDGTSSGFNPLDYYEDPEDEQAANS